MPSSDIWSPPARHVRLQPWVALYPLQESAIHFRLHSNPMVPGIGPIAPGSAQHDLPAVKKRIQPVAQVCLLVLSRQITHSGSIPTANQRRYVEVMASSIRKYPTLIRPTASIQRVMVVTSTGDAGIFADLHAAVRRPVVVRHHGKP